MSTAGWLPRMAWRESRGSRPLLLMTVAPIVLGVALLVATQSFRAGVQQAVDDQARSLTGGDAVLTARRGDAMTEVVALAKMTGAQTAQEVVFTSSVRFGPQGEAGGRLVQVRAVGEGFPLAGKIETQGAALGAWQKEGGALVESALLRQFEQGTGSVLSLGQWTGVVRDELKKVPGESVLLGALAPRVFIRLEDLPKLDVLGPGSLVRYRIYLHWTDPEAGLRQLKLQQARLDALSVEVETSDERKKDVGKALETLTQFLNVTGVLALILGGLGVGGGLQTFLQTKKTHAAILRCLGAPASEVAWIYGMLALGLSSIGTVAGVVLGLGLQAVLVTLLQPFLPVEIQVGISAVGIGLGAGFGLGAALLFTVWPVQEIRKARALSLLRAEKSPVRTGILGRLFGVAIALAFVWGFLLLVTQNAGFAGWSWLGLMGAGAVFLLAASGVKALARFLARFVPGYPVRQGLSNLHRPENRTLLVLAAVGLCAGLSWLVLMGRDAVLESLRVEKASGQANALLLDVQPDQLPLLRETLEANRFPLFQTAPLITMRLVSVQGQLVSTLLADPGHRIPPWMLQREYRSTFRDHLVGTEKILAGQWVARHEGGLEQSIPVSVEKKIAQDLGLGLGGTLEFDLAGVRLRCHVASLREVEWRRVSPNFFIVFPAGVLEDAPAFYLGSTRVENAEDSGRLQRLLGKALPNVSVLDLTMILATLDALLQSLEVVSRWLAVFLSSAAVLVLVAVLAAGRHQRLKEAALLRVLGASRAHIRMVFATEYLALGVLGSVTGLGVALVSSWILSVQVFQTPWQPGWGVMIGLALGSAGLTGLVGWLTNRIGTKTTPLELLRSI